MHRAGRVRPSVGRVGLVLVSAALAVASLAACSFAGARDDPAATSRPIDPAPPTGSIEVPSVLVPGGTAEENRPLFDAVGSGAVAADPDADARALVDALVAAGFDKAAIEVTDDRTAIGGRADAVQIAVRASDACIIGERSASGYASLVAPVLGTGRCLVGETRPIDW